MNNIPDELIQTFQEYKDAVQDVDDFTTENAQFLGTYHRLRERKKQAKVTLVESVTQLHRAGVIDKHIFDDLINVGGGYELTITNDEQFNQFVLDHLRELDITMGSAFRPNMTNVRQTFIDAVYHRHVPVERVEQSEDGFIFYGPGYKVEEVRKVHIAKELK